MAALFYLIFSRGFFPGNFQILKVSTTKINFCVKWKMTTEKFRESALGEIFAEFDAKLQESIENFNKGSSDIITEQDIEIVKNKYRNAFINYFTTAFDIVFLKELLEAKKKWVHTRRFRIQSVRLGRNSELRFC